LEIGSRRWADQLPTVAEQGIDRNDSGLQHTLTPADIQKAGLGKIPCQIAQGIAGFAQSSRVAAWPRRSASYRRIAFPLKNLLNTLN
jgi:hypothetical protein